MPQGIAYRTAAALLGFGVMPAAAASELVPHRAVYDLSLATQTDEIVGVDGRIALELTVPECGVYDLDYRFVARFQYESETTLTDLRTVTRERDGGSYFRFETTTLVDGVEQSRVRGEARNESDVTQVDMEAPVERSFTLPASLFPLSHTTQLIERAARGERLVETRLVDGDNEAEKLLTTTAIILPAQPRSLVALPEAVSRAVQDMRAWRIDESFFNSDSDADGMPVFESRYTLYENGVTDDVLLDFGDYALSGSLARLDYLELPEGCE